MDGTVVGGTVVDGTVVDETVVDETVVDGTVVDEMVVLLVTQGSGTMTWQKHEPWLSVQKVTRCGQEGCVVHPTASCGLVVNGVQSEA